LGNVRRLETVLVNLLLVDVEPLVTV